MQAAHKERIASHNATDREDTTIERPHMTSAIAARVRRTLQLGRAADHDHVHFHIGANGRPFVCDLDRCESPGITADDMGLSRR